MGPRLTECIGYLFAADFNRLNCPLRLFAIPTDCSTLIVRFNSARKKSHSIDATHNA